ncbi:hypothetical protein Taro_046657 [Colocasia esculenta]|uniref:Uncharacterized protein n=1 Tax=Colocasia esculenta TaxID=4460 RepID=A0A843X4F1_COLES|nr:hypothetical protein [Colocasia esculenta]
MWRVISYSVTVFPRDMRRKNFRACDPSSELQRDTGIRRQSVFFVQEAGDGDRSESSSWNRLHEQGRKWGSSSPSRRGFLRREQEVTATESNPFFEGGSSGASIRADAAALDSARRAVYPSNEHFSLENCPHLKPILQWSQVPSSPYPHQYSGML